MKVQAAVCHEASKPLVVEDIEPRWIQSSSCDFETATRSPGTRRSVTAILWVAIVSICFGPPWARSQVASGAGPAELVESSDRVHWAFQSPERPPVPELEDTARIRTPVDAFVSTELEKRDLALSPDADRVTLLRRACFDLIGLPPTPEEVDTFLADPSPDAYETIIDRLIASPRYGERWGRHWLDLAGYADSEGVLDADVIRANAWRYRDYVIRAFNSDKPYNDFLKEQLAGDELSEYRKYDELPPRVVEMLEATGYLRNAVDATRADFLPKHFVEFQWRTLFDTQQIVASSLMGLTIQCARCHDHKYEPLSQEDYYRMVALFRGAFRPYGSVLPTYERVVVVSTEEQRKANERVDREVKALKGSQAAHVAQYRAKHPKGDGVTDKELRELFPEYAREADRLKEQLEKEQAKRLKFPTIRALYDLDANPPSTHRLIRGKFQNPGEVVEPGVPVVLDDPERPFHATYRPQAESSGRRTAFAEWLTRVDHPLTARVVMNHVWARHFGTGIVPTVENFGTSGAPPTNQPLLDWLATEFVRQGWSVKTMHRLIMTSTVYRQGSLTRKDAPDRDPDNKLLSRMTPRRLEGEIVRDTVLAVAGTLDLEMYGEPVGTESKSSGEIVPVGDPSSGRRSVYQLVRRSRPQSFFEVFDFPVMEINCMYRQTSTSAPQALALMNSEFISSQAEQFARRVLKDAPLPPAPGSAVQESTAQRAFRLALSRQPSAREIDMVLKFLHKQSVYYSDDDTDTVTFTKGALRLYADLCQALLSTNECIYAD